MNLYVLVVSRLVPVILWISFCLVAGRYVHDRFRDNGKVLAARFLFAGILVIGGGTAALFGWRAAMLVAAESHSSKGEWAAAADSFARYDRSGGSISDWMRIEWATALMQERRFNEALAVIMTGLRTKNGKQVLSRELVLRVAQCAYYQQQYDRAENAFRASAGSSQDFLRHYYLGRIAEIRGNAAEAERHQLDALKIAPTFFPAFYSSVRLQIAHGDRQGASQRLDAFARQNVVASHNPLFAALVRATQDGSVPQPVEFYVTTD